MKKLNLFLLFVLIVLIGIVVWYFVGGALDAAVYSITAPASDHPEAYASIAGILSSGSAPQQVIVDLPSIEQCRLIDITVTLSNKGFFPAEWVDVTVEPASGDVAVYSLSGEGSDIPSRSSGQINLKLITTAPENASRTLHLSYYVYGMPRTLSIP